MLEKAELVEIMTNRRKELKMSFGVLGDRTGLPVSAITGYERGKTELHPVIAAVVCEELFIDPASGELLPLQGFVEAPKRRRSIKKKKTIGVAISDEMREMLNKHTEEKKYKNPSEAVRNILAEFFTA